MPAKIRQTACSACTHGGIQYAALLLPSVTLPADFDASFTSSLWFRGEADGDGANHTVYVEVKRTNACLLTVPRMSFTWPPVIEKRSSPAAGSGPARLGASKLRPPV